MRKLWILIFVLISFTLVSCQSKDAPSDISETTRFEEQIATESAIETTEESTMSNEQIQESETESSSVLPSSTEADGDTENKDVGSDYSNKYIVHNAEQLLEALGPDRTILLYPGNYDLMATRYYKSVIQDKKNVDEINVRHKSSYYRVNENNIYKFQFCDLDNLKIIGMPEENAKMVDFITKNMAATVLSFDNCSNLQIMNLNIGHAASGCMGDVLSISSSKDIMIDNCILYGCGVNGLVCNNTQNVQVKNTSITDCTSKLMVLNSCNDFIFENSEFSARYIGINYSNCSNVSFENCFLTDQPLKKLNFANVDLMNEYIDEIQNPIDNGDIVFNWVKGYNDLGPKSAKIEFNNNELDKQDLKIHIVTDIGHFMKRDNGNILNIGREYIGQNLDGIFWVDDNDKNWKSLGFCSFSIYSPNNNELISSSKCKVFSPYGSNACYTLHEGRIPAIVNPTGNGYVYEDMFLPGEYSLGALLNKYGDSYTVKEYHNRVEYIYNTGLILVADKDSTDVSAFHLANMPFEPGSIKKTVCNFMDNHGDETLILYRIDYNYSLAVLDSNANLLKNFKLSYRDIQYWGIYDFNNDGIEELYLRGQDNGKLLIIDDGDIKPFYSIGDCKRYNEDIKAAIEDNKLSISADIDGMTVNVESILPERTFYNTKDYEDKNKLLFINNDWDIIKVDGKYLIRNSYTNNLKIIEYYWGPPGFDCTPNAAMYNDLVVIDVLLEYTENGFKPVNLSFKVKYDNGNSKNIKPMFHEEGSLVDGPALGMSMKEAYKALGGNVENFKSTDYLKYDGVELSEFCGEVVGITVNTNKYTTVRGLKVGDTIERVEEIYGKPDLGFSGDEYVEYKFCRGTEDEPYLNYYRTLIIYYENGLVSKFNLYQVILD